MISVINESDFNVNHGLYVVKFWATWCRPCKLMDPTISLLEEKFNNIKFLSVDIEQVPELARKFEIQSIPTLSLIKDGKEVRKIVGVYQLKALEAFFKELAGDVDEPINNDLDVAL